MRAFKATILAATLLASGGAYALDTSVTGSVRDGDSTLPGAVVKVVGTNIQVSTGFDGKFNLANLPAGKHMLAISFIGYETRMVEIEVKEGERFDLGSVTVNLDDAGVEEIRVVGTILRGEMRALNSQKAANRIINVISATGIGKLPDRNAAEAVQRVPGISIERDQGEGRFVAVRGLPSQWSSSSINGDRLPTAEEETTSRATAFDFFPTEMIEFVEVSKAVTPDMEGDAIGGNVNFITRTAPEDFTLNVSAGIGYSEKADKASKYANVMYGDRTDDGKFGFILNGTAWIRDWATDNFEPRRGGDGLGVRRLELRDYVGERETYGLNGAMEYNLDNGGRIYARGLYGTLADTEVHYKHRYRFDKDRVEVQHIHNELITRMWGGEIGGEHNFGTSSQLEWKVATYDNEFHYGDIPDSVDNSYFVVRFDQKNVGYTGLEDRGAGNLAYNEIDGGTDSADMPSTHLPSGFSMDPALTQLAWVELYKVYINEKDKIIASVDWTETVNHKLELKFGAKFRDKERVAEFSDEFYAWDEAAGPVPTLADFTLTDQPGRDGYLDDINASYAADFSQVMPIEDVSAWYVANKQNLVLVPEESALVSNGGALGRHFNVDERQIAGYGMATYKPSEKTTIVGGVRLEHTRTRVDGQVYVTNDDTGESGLVPRMGEKDYLSVLPSLHVKYAANDLTNIRASVTRTFARPDFGSLTPGGSYSEHDNEFFSGNPELNPTYSWNFDLMVERYFGNVGVISAGAFYKSIKDPIFQSSRIGDYNGKTGVTFFEPQNGDNAWLWGLEFNLNRQLDFLPGFLSNLGVIANYTYMDSKMTIPGRDDSAAIPRQADNLANFTLYYEDDKFSTRLALNYKDDFIEEHGSDADSDSYYGKYTSLDWSASYHISDQFLIYAELNNLLNEPLTYFLGDKERPLQREYYGRRGQIGFKYKF